jgi:16S rRNA (cytosine967-C5)-methyltransferase
MIAPARVAAYQALLALSNGRSDLPAAIEHARATLADDRDQALMSEIVTGVQRWRAALDHLIVTVSKRTLDRLDPEIVEILRLSLYQLLHLTRVPAAAVVDDAVKLAGKAGKRSASGLVNAVLRTASRQRQSLPLPPRPHDGTDREAALEYLSITLSHPRWLVGRWLARFGFEATESWLKFNNAPAPLTLRANTLVITASDLAARLDERGVATRPGVFAPDALMVESGNPLKRGQDIQPEWFVIQDEASQLVTLLAGKRPGSMLLDACASPGGKTTAFAATIGTNGRVIACDVRARRMTLLRKTVERTRAENVSLVRADVLQALPFRVLFDSVVVDAPCSGLGTLRRDPDIRWRRVEGDLPALASAQLRMLANAAERVARGGRLVYATCSSEPEEDEHVAEQFLRATAGFRAVDARTVHPGLSPALVDARGHFRTMSDRDGLEAFFGAIFERL